MTAKEAKDATAAGKAKNDELDKPQVTYGDPLEENNGLTLGGKASLITN